jgi:solute carrier family 10 (sodium/bile acid cotransporter), member 7
MKDNVMDDNNNDDEEEDVSAQSSISMSHIKECVYGFVDRNFFQVYLLLAIICAAIYPHLGESEGPLYPDYSISYGATMFIFIISGLTLKSNELLKSVLGFKFNTTVQLQSLLMIPLIMWGVVMLLKETAMSEALLDGLLIAGSLPTTVNMCVFLTASAGGDEAAALFNATLGNFLGIFITPVWMMTLVSVHSTVSVSEVTLKLFIKVLVPVAFGQVMRAMISKHNPAWLKVNIIHIII